MPPFQAGTVAPSVERGATPGALFMKRSKLVLTVRTVVN